LTLKVFDDAVQNIIDHVNNVGMMDNTYVIFASDNGGCLYNGGRNYPLRGSKATLFEGGTKVDSFIYSPTLLKDQSGIVYDNLFHVSDWFPTILDMAGASYDAPADYELDGYSHYEAISNNDDADYDVVPREYMLYNAYTKVMEGDGAYTFDVWTNGVFAIRNSQYKLIHSYNGSKLMEAVNDDVVNDDDAELSIITDCKQVDAYDGAYQMELFDLDSDPYETKNLYYSEDDDIIAIRVSCRRFLSYYASIINDSFFGTDDSLF
jgi:arylsulfatase A-like enzyme